ncbi:hypothetical protein MKW94_000426 [Papaver nudicaule]|uniref:Major facilitator superfamily (MFS) profile domain-containing protein n=1 Tax=Papaver nudicaule TaxID=74823 RepID=A0AA41SNV2_PAPNU|nr:hypothetical protein [Papaver nudicaule]
MLIFGRVLLGIGVGFANQAVPLYMSEMAPARYRGAITNGFHLCVHVGILYANFINFGTEKIKGGSGWRVSLAMGAIPALVLTIGSFFLPETPNSLIQRGVDSQKAKLVLRRVRSTADVQVELDDLIKASSVSKTLSHHPLPQILQRKYRPQLTMAIAIPFFQQVTGINVIAFYAPLLFRTIGVGESLVGTCSEFITILTVDKIGRRPLFMIDHTELMTNGYAYSVLVLICVYVCGFAISWGPLAWLVPSEIFPLEIRSIGQSINVALGLMFTFVIAQTFLAMLCHLKAGIFFFFGGWVFVMTGFVYFLLPETNNVPIEKMVKIWRKHWYWKRFVGE